VVFSQALKVRLNCASYLSRVLHREEVANDLRIMLGLPREAERRIFLCL
jgi:hypothetical protein